MGAEHERLPMEQPLDREPAAKVAGGSNGSYPAGHLGQSETEAKLLDEIQGYRDWRFENKGTEGGVREYFSEYLEFRRKQPKETS